MAAMSLFVLLWGGAAIFTRWALDHGSVFAVLTLRFALALGATLLIGLHARRWLPEPETRRQVAATGLLLIGCYSVFYFQAMAHGVTPGLIATVLGVQPILTLMLTERRFSLWRLLGLLLALSGLTLVVFQSLILAKLPCSASLALAALLCMTLGRVKRIQQAGAVLPLQYAATLGCAWSLRRSSRSFEASLDFFIPLLGLGL